MTTFACASAYGFALGSAHSELYATRNLLKFPLLIAITGTVCALAYWLVARLFEKELSFLAVQRATGRLFHDMSVLLASLSPAVLFLAWTSRARDDGRLGDYDSFLAFNMAIVAIAGSLALMRQTQQLFTQHGVDPLRAKLLVGAWLLLSLGVGGQAAFVMRPFFGFPATRGNTPPFFVGAEPDLRGATNFYESVWQTIQRPRLPAWLEEESGQR
ncbi:MAG TPA: hypothetical protein VM509_11770 [Planctomycetota bacterium]|nr:hypothetical protein [Planctomycetota bacterium]